MDIDINELTPEQAHAAGVARAERMTDRAAHVHILIDHLDEEADTPPERSYVEGLKAGVDRRGD